MTVLEELYDLEQVNRKLCEYLHIDVKLYEPENFMKFLELKFDRGQYVYDLQYLDVVYVEDGLVLSVLLTTLRKIEMELSSPGSVFFNFNQFIENCKKVYGRSENCSGVQD